MKYILGAVFIGIIITLIAKDGWEIDQAVDRMQESQPQIQTNMQALSNRVAELELRISVIEVNNVINK